MVNLLRQMDGRKFIFLPRYDERGKGDSGDLFFQIEGHQGVRGPADGDGGIDLDPLLLQIRDPLGVGSHVFRGESDLDNLIEEGGVAPLFQTLAKTLKSPLGMGVDIAESGDQYERSNPLRMV